MSCEVRSTYLERAARGLRDFLEETCPDVLVLATHGRGPVSRNWLGSTTDRLARAGLVPLLVVRPDGDGDPEPGAAASMRRVLVPLDGSELAEGAVEGAVRLLRADAQLVLLRVVESGPMPGSLYIPDQIRDSREAEEEASRYMDEAVARFGGNGRRVEGRVRLGERASLEIVAAAEEVGADLIAIATHGRGGLVRAALGSVTDKVIRTASTPVLVLPASQASD
ncbi:MAG: universal stress protein [Gemmatimonadetes bacterium]|nr:universal stress protein [Gemmatimonadota bacterium]